KRPNDVLLMAPENIAAIFGKVLREQRNARGISQEALALSADVDRTFVSQMERGIRQPTLTTLCKLSEALEIQPSTLVARMEKLRRCPRVPRAPRTRPASRLPDGGRSKRRAR